jgi:uroporphyrinogen decarboxylase
MNSVDRILKALGGEETDSIPVLPVLLLQGAKELNLSIPEYFQNHEHIAKGQELLVEKYGHDGVYGIPHVVGDIEAFGGQIAYSEYGAPTVGKMALRTWNDLDNLPPINIENCPCLVRTLKTLELLAKKFKGEKLIIGGAIGPFSLPSMLIGTEAWFELLWEDEVIREPIMKKVLTLAKNFCASWCNAQIQAGADVVVLADGIASATCIMKEQFQTLAMPIIKETISAIQGTVVFEPVGAIQPFLNFIPELGAGVLILECHDNLKQCKESLQGKVGIMGNLNNIELIRWDKETTFKNAMDAITQAGSGGFILSTQGPEIPFETPEENIHAIVQAARTWKKK